MAVQIALLRAINVAGHNCVSMSDLRDLLTALRFTNVKSLLQSGNLIFSTDRSTGTALESLLEKETAKRLEVSTDYLIRTAAEWKKAVARNPFPKEAISDPGHLVLMFLKTAPKAK